VRQSPKLAGENGLGDELEGGSLRIEQRIRRDWDTADEGQSGQLSCGCDLRRVSEASDPHLIREKPGGCQTTGEGPLGGEARDVSKSKGRPRDPGMPQTQQRAG
jgi:hypothetical protein